MIAHGLCHCGCGKPTKLATMSSLSRGWVRGQPLRYIVGHMGGINASAAYRRKLGVDAEGRPTKLCTSCKQPQLVQLFDKSRSSDKLESHCQICQREHARAFYRKNPEPYKRRARVHRKSQRGEVKARLERIKRLHGCRACPEKNIVCLDFHHVDVAMTDRPVGRTGTVIALEREVAKCVVLCANCHRKAHAGLLKILRSWFCQGSDGRART